MQKLRELLAPRSVRVLALLVVISAVVVAALTIWQKQLPLGSSLVLPSFAVPIYIFLPLFLLAIWALADARAQTSRVSAREATKRRDEVGMLLAAAERLNGAAELEEVLFRLVEVAGSTLKAARVIVHSLEEEMRGSQVYVWEGGAWHADQIGTAQEDAVSNWVASHAQPYLSVQPPEDLQFTSEPDKRNGHSLLAVPICNNDNRLLAVLTISDRQDGHAFSEEDRQLAEGIAYETAIALERAALAARLRQSEERYRHQALHDHLTDLPNRTLFMDRLEHALAGAQRSNAQVAVFFLNLDGFKGINDVFGHGVGDAVLQEVGKRLATCMRAGDTVARFGSDEFIVLLPAPIQAERAIPLAERVIASLQPPFHVGQEQISVSGSVGITLSRPGDKPDQAGRLLREADIAIQYSKRQSRGQTILFEPRMHEEIAARLHLELELRRALEQEELRLYYQPEVDFQTRRVLGVEALLRWQHPQLGLLPPMAFLSVAEERGLVPALGSWVLEEACRQLRSWQELGPDIEHWHVSVNVSASQLHHGGLREQLDGLLKTHDLDPGCLTLELTESVLVQDPEAAAATLGDLRNLGVQLALDDFGTGYSSLSYLARLPIDILKVDQSFVRGLGQDPTAKGIVQAIIGLARTLGMEVTVEGVETEAQLAELRSLRCVRGQGYLFSTPLASEAATDVYRVRQLPGAGAR